MGCIGAFVLLQVLSYVANVRVESGRSASLESMRLENNGSIDAVAEMGGTMFCLIKHEISFRKSKIIVMENHIFMLSHP